MQGERVVEITFGKESIGSGYLITPRHVLTARHVIKPDPPVKGMRCAVRALVAPESVRLPLRSQVRPDAMPGQVGWLRPKPHPDLAIIELDPPYSVALPPEPIGFWSIPANDLGRWLFSCDGFPAAAGGGTKSVGGSLTYDPVNKRFDLDLGGALPVDYKEWAGLSGALVFCDERAVGVVWTVDGNWQGLLKATPTQFLLEDEDFQQYWSTQKMPLPRLTEATRGLATVLERISAHVYLIDRKDPLNEIKKRLRSLTGAVPSQVISIVGKDDDEHSYFIRQLSEDLEVQNLLGRQAKSEDVIVPLTWPLEERQINPDEKFRLQIERLCSVANVAVPPRGQIDADIAAFRKSFDRGATPRAFWTMVRRKIAFGGHSDLLRRLLDFWTALGEGAPVILFLCIAWDEPDPPKSHSLFSRKPPQPEIKLEEEIKSASQRLESRWSGIDELEEISGDHVGPWINELRYRCEALRQGQLEGLRLSLLSRVASPKRIRKVAADIGDLLRDM